MRIRILVGLGLGIGVVSLSGCTQPPAEANAPFGTAPTPLIPETYTAPPAAAVAPTAFAPAPASLTPVSAAAHAPRVRAGQVPAMTLHPYHPYWMVDVH